MQREPNQHHAATAQREVVEQLSQKDVSERYSNSVVTTMPQEAKGGPRGFQLEHVRRAALEARKAKQGY